MWQNTGFIQNDNIDVKDAMQTLAYLMDLVRRSYEKMSTDELLTAVPGKWSKQQILGHLIDSAVNNLKRFTEAQFQEQPYTIIAYEQNELMQVNHYQQLPIEHLLKLWESINQQILFVIEKIADEKLNYPVQPQYNQTGTQSLAWMICDYVAHMQHHLKQVL